MISRPAGATPSSNLTMEDEMASIEPNHRRLSVVYQDVSALKPRPGNPRTHSKKQITQIANAIRRFGFTNPVLVDDANGIVAGHGRVEAAKIVGLDQVPTVRLSAMSEAEIRAYVIADNRLAENAGWDRALLGLELQYLTELEIDFDVAVTGFDLPEIDLLIGELSLAANDNDAADAVVEFAAGPAVARPGDIWRIGNHRLICGDSTKLETYQQLLGDARAQMVFTDPPYNVPISGHVGGLGAIQHREFAMASGEMSRAEFTAFLQSVFGHLGTAPHINNVELGRHGRNRTNVWSYAGVNSFGGDRADLSLHPTVKPVAMVADAIRDCSHRKGIVLDAFLGSGTTLS